MFGVLLALFLPIVFVLVARATSTPAQRGRLLPALVAAYAARIVLQFFGRSLPIFSYGTGGDFAFYQRHAEAIARIWHFSGVRFMTQEQIPELGATTLPSNLFALIFYVNGEPTTLGCTAVLACMMCLTALNLYHLALELGADEARAYRVAALALFSPSLVLYTSDLYKDGLVFFLVTGALGSSFRLSRRISALHAVLGALSLLALWFVRFYLIFVAVGPLVVGLVGLRARGSVRPLVAALLLGVAAIVVVEVTHVARDVTETANRTFEGATSEDAMVSNAENGGSGVLVGGNGPGAMALKLLYTLFSPFPWQGGSIAMQVGKLEGLMWYYLMYRAARAARYIR
jgi:hypothetical protein